MAGNVKGITVTVYELPIMTSRNPMTSVDLGSSSGSIFSVEGEDSVGLNNVLSLMMSYQRTWRCPGIYTRCLQLGGLGHAHSCIRKAGREPKQFGVCVP